MAMIKCKECGKEISDKAVNCPNCGCPITPIMQQTVQPVIQQKPKKKGSCLATILIVFGILIFIGVITPSSGDKDKEKQSAQIDNIQKEDAIEKTNKKIDNTFIQSGEIYSGNNVIISVQGYDSNDSYITIPFLIENNSTLNLGFNAHAYSINNIMTGNNIYDMDCDVASGKKANAELKIKKSILEKYEIDTVKTFDVLFWAYDNDKNFKEFDTGQITIHTSGYDEKINILSGENIYDDKGVKVEYLSNDNNEYTYCITNNTGNYFDFDVENITINDYTSSDWDFDLMNVVVLNSCQATFSIKVTDEFAKLNNIDNIQKIEFTLNIRPLGDYFSDWSTEMITYNVQ